MHFDEDLHATAEIKDEGSVNEDLHPTMETKDDEGSTVGEKECDAAFVKICMLPWKQRTRDGHVDEDLHANEGGGQG